MIFAPEFSFYKMKSLYLFIMRHLYSSNYKPKPNEMKKITIIITLLLCTIFSFSQDKKSELEGIKKNGISLYLFGTTPVVGVTYERIISEYMSLEIGVGTPGFGVGAKIMPFKIKASSMMFTTGLTTIYADYGNSFLANGKRVIVYVPIGISYYGTKGFNFGIDVGPAYRITIKDPNGYNDNSQFIPYAGIKIGQRF